MSPPPYMRLYWGDYHRDTRHLTRSEHGAYLMLLSALWNSGGKIAADDDTLAKRAMCSPEEWAAMKSTIMEFFKVVRGKLTHSRVTSELAKYESAIGKRKEAGKRGGSATHGKDVGNSQANAKQTPPEPEPEPERIEPTISKAGVPEWKEMLEEAKATAGDMADLTRPAMNHAADLRALVEPRSGEPCEWSEVLVAIELVAMRQRQRGKPIQSWAWVKDDACALRDKRLNAINPAPNVVPISAGGGRSSLVEQIGRDNDEARRLAFAKMDAMEAERG